jgi:hypothetical protein
MLGRGIRRYRDQFPSRLDFLLPATMPLLSILCSILLICPQALWLLSVPAELANLRVCCSRCTLDVENVGCRSRHLRVSLSSVTSAEGTNICSFNSLVTQNSLDSNLDHYDGIEHGVLFALFLTLRLGLAPTVSSCLSALHSSQSKLCTHLLSSFFSSTVHSRSRV